MKLLHFTYYLLPLVLCSCTMSRPYNADPDSNHYAKGFSITHGENYTTVVAYSPWQNGAVLETYYLVKSDSISTPRDGLKLRVPIRRLTVTSCTHIGFLKALGELETVYGICSPEIVYNREVFSPSDGHEVMNVGDAMTPDVERILRTAPDAVMVSTYAQGDAATEKMRSLALPIIYNNEWTENDPLARAEWIRFVGAFCDCLPLADSIFGEVEKAYNTLKSGTENISEHRTIMSGNNFRGTWYMPAGSTYMGVLFRDAGADYFYSSDTSHFSIPLGIETVIHNFANADVWVGCPASSLAELAQMDEKHTWFKSYKSGEVYNFARRTTATGGNDFWETGVVRPDYILSDLIHILYPAISQNNNLQDQSPQGTSLQDATFYFSEHLH